MAELEINLRELIRKNFKDALIGCITDTDPANMKRDVVAGLEASLRDLFPEATAEELAVSVEVDPATTDLLLPGPGVDAVVLLSALPRYLSMSCKVDYEGQK